MIVGSPAGSSIRVRRFALLAVALAISISACSTLPTVPRRKPPRAEFRQCPVSARDSMGALLEKVRGCMLTSRTGWLQGSGWSPLLFESVPVVDNPLDNVETTGPIALLSEDGRAYWVNHVGLELAGITAATPDPPGGRIGRLPGTFVPNGILYEEAMGLVDRLLPKEPHP